MTTETSLPGTVQESQSAIRRVLWWWNRREWRRLALGMTEADIDELRKRIVIINRQLEELPYSSRVFRRRMEILDDRTRCETIIETWETKHGS